MNGTKEQKLIASPCVVVYWQAAAAAKERKSKGNCFESRSSTIHEAVEIK